MALNLTITCYFSHQLKPSQTAKGAFPDPRTLQGIQLLAWTSHARQADDLVSLSVGRNRTRLFYFFFFSFSNLFGAVD